MFTAQKIGSLVAMVGSFLALAAAPAFAEGSVKVECQGNCATITLGQVCDKFGAGTNPVSISCDDTATPGSGTNTACGTGAGRCTSFGSIVRGDLVSAYCTDGGGNDVVVTCK